MQLLIREIDGLAGMCVCCLSLALLDRLQGESLENKKCVFFCSQY